MKKEFKINKENYSEELQKQFKINKDKFYKALENTKKGLILVNDKECFVLGCKSNIETLLTTIVIRLYSDKVMTESELMHVVKRGIEFVSFEKEMKKEKEFANKVEDLLKSIKKIMED